MTQTGWMHLGILLLVFVGAVAFVLRRMVLPAPKEGAQGETVAGSKGFNEAHSGHYSAGHSGGADSGHGGS
ncbi:hypothetical protein [Mesorhizobium sp. ES1-3]|uniref:hypothetical protein n=1 Tax=Mesorhizobium sp. ES1-3 TaxID=2876628 RepID=UPI001CCFE687|nr:hypothetical protein [Mesorhizobium sp. ES1-3]MBZ9673044.1 hypothetical protein [Mesorhizobium sp. ES1-3]